MNPQGDILGRKHFVSGRNSEPQHHPRVMLPLERHQNFHFGSDQIRPRGQGRIGEEKVPDKFLGATLIRISVSFSYFMLIFYTIFVGSIFGVIQLHFTGLGMDFMKSRCIVVGLNIVTEIEVRLSENKMFRYRYNCHHRRFGRIYHDINYGLCAATSCNLFHHVILASFA